METVFLKLLNMSITAGWIVLAILVLRLMLRKAPKGLVSLLWILVAVRLVCPFSLESVWSLIPSVETVPEDIGMMQEPAIHSGVPMVNHVVNPMLQESFTPEPMNSVNPLQVVTWLAAYIWVIGVAVMILYVAISYWRIYRRVRIFMPIEKGVRACDEIDAPFILGVFRPVIYLPSRLENKDLEYVLAHERAHLKRKDHLWKPLAFALLTLYWFQPLLWVAYLFFSRDIEMACDERVIREMDLEEKREYTRTLLSCSMTEKQLPACPLAFGEVGVKGRVKSMKNYKKPSVILAVIAVLVLVLGGIFFLTNPKEKEEEEKLEQALTEAIEVSARKWGDAFFFEDHVVLGVQDRVDGKIVYLMAYAENYGLEEDVLIKNGGFHMPMAVTMKEDVDGYSVEEIWTPRDGAEYKASIREKFPWYLWGRVNTQDYIEEQQARCRAQVAEVKNRMDEHNNAMDIMQGAVGERFYPEFDHEVAYLGKESLPELYVGAVDGYRLTMSSVQYFPVHKIDSAAELAMFQGGIQNPDALKSENGRYPSYLKVVEKYDEAFFEEHTLFLVYCSMGMGTYCSVNSVVINQVDGENYLGIHVKEGYAPAHQPTVPGWNWLLFVEMKRDDVKADYTIYATDMQEDGNTRVDYVFDYLSAYYETAYAGYTEKQDFVWEPDDSSEVNHLPGILIKDKELLREEALKGFEEKGLLLDQGYQELPSLREAVKKYDEDFFREKDLVMIYLPVSVDSYRYEVTQVFRTIENGTPGELYIQVGQKSKPEETTPKNAGWMLLVPLEKNLVLSEDHIFVVQDKANMEQLIWEQHEK